MINSTYANFLIECGLEVNKSDFIYLDEANQVQVTDDALTGMMKFITDKYNSIDFGEIEKSAGDIMRFKYTKMLEENLETLDNIYKNAVPTDPGAKKYCEVILHCRSVLNFLQSERMMFSALFKGGNGMVQLLYTSLVAGVIYCVGILVSNTIRFVTTEKDTDCEVLFDEIPGTLRHCHIKNMRYAYNSLSNFQKYLNESYKVMTKRQSVSESVTLGSVALGIAAVGAFIALIPNIINLIREIIYSIYCTRTKISDMLAIQQDLIRTNIESLEAGRGDVKVIARQKKIAEKLEKWKVRFAMKADTTDNLKNAQMKKENQTLRIDKNSPLMNRDDSTDGILL